METARLILRDLDDQDVDALVRALASFNVSRGTSSIPHPYLREDAVAFVKRQKSKTSASVKKVIALKTEPQDLIGSVRLHIGPAPENCELGYWIAEPHWGNGYATEAAKAMVDHAFNRLKFSRVTAEHDNDNIASRRVLVRLGFVEMGVCEGFSVARNEIVPGKLMELTAQSWRLRKI